MAERRAARYNAAVGRRQAVARRKSAARRRRAPSGRAPWARWLRRLGLGVAGCAVASVLGVALFRFVEPPVTPLMVIRLAEGLTAWRWVGIDHRPIPLARVNAALLRAVIAAEDAGFFRHRGVDWEALRKARAWNARHARSGRIRGASTITMQCARNVFLWQGRTYVRKTLEIWFAGLMERLWSKRRILEVYLNVIEWGPGVYGAEAAARRAFGIPASRLDARQAALLAAVLPSPRRWSARAPSPYVARRAAMIARRADRVRLPRPGGW